MLSVSKSNTKPSNQRHYEYDWLRIISVIIIIFYHVGLIFVNTRPLINHDSWIISNYETSDKLQVALIFLKQWSLSLLFLISGIGIKFSLKRKSTSDVIEERFKRLLIPLTFGLLFINPIQDFYNQKLISSELSLSITNFISLFIDATFSFHHLWFIAFLFIFSILCLPFFNFINKNEEKSTEILSILSTKYGLILLVIPLVLYEIYLDFLVPYTRIYAFNFNRIIYIIIFIYGYLFASIPSMNEIFLKSKFRNLFIGIVLAPVYYYSASYLDPKTSISSFIVISSIKYTSCLVWIFAILGFSIQYLSFKNKFLIYCNEAVYPFYILHQVVLIIIGFEVIQLPISYLEKFVIIFIGTLTVCLLLFLVIKKNMFLRISFGLKTDFSTNKVQIKVVTSQDT